MGRAARPKRQKRGMAARPEHRSPELVRRNWFREASGVVWVADFTHMCTREGWMYMSFLQDGFSRGLDAEQSPPKSPQL